MVVVKSSLNFPNISNLVELSKKYVSEIDSNNQRLMDILEKLTSIIFQPSIQLVQRLDSNKRIFKNGAEDAIDFLEDCMKSSYLCLCGAFSLGREYIELYPDSTRAILAAENFDSISFIDATRNELKTLSDYASVLIMRLDEMTYQARIEDKDTSIKWMDSRRAEMRDAIFWAFKDGIVSYYKEKGLL
jgi:hypothetical protein